MKVELQVGDGDEFVYVYYFRSQVARERWPCKIGHSRRDWRRRILDQQASMQEMPVVGLLIRTPSAVHTEKKLHALLAKHRLKTFGKEWFNTSPAEVLNLHEHGEIDLSLGVLIRLERLQMGWSQTDLAQRAGTRQNVISHIENDSPGTQLYSLLSVVAALGMKLTVSPK